MPKGEDLQDAVDTWLDDHPEATTTVEDGAITKAKLNSGLQGTVDDVDDLIDHETYTEGGSGETTVEYEPITENSHIDEARTQINASGTAAISTPASSTVRIYPVENGKTYKVVGRCINTNERPLLIVADSVVSSGAIALSGNFEYQLGTSSTAGVEEAEYTTLRAGYLYITATTSDCGVWLKKTIAPSERKFYIDDVRNDLPHIKTAIESLDSVVFRKLTDSASALVKSVPWNAEKTAEITSMADSVTSVRTIVSRNLANKDAVGDVTVDSSGTLKKGIRTILLPPGRYYINLGSMGAYTFVKKVENGLFGDTLYQEQFPMRITITDPRGGYFIVYASSVSNLGDMSALMIGRLKDTESTLTFEAYAEKTYTPETLEAENRIEVIPGGFIEFVNSGSAAVSSTVQYLVHGKDDETTTSKDFVVSPNGTKFLQMVKNDGSTVYARVVPKKALFIGNSLTSGWQTFGEAATDSDNDFVAKFSSVVVGMDDSYTFSRIWATGFEQKTSLADAQSWTTSNIDPSLSDDLDLIVVQLSENVTGSSQAAAFPETSLWLLQHLRETCPKARVVWMGVWFDRGLVSTLLDNTKKTGCEYIDIKPLYIPANISTIGSLYTMDEEYTKSYDVDSFTVGDDGITMVFTVDGTEYTSTIPSYTSYTSSGDTQISVTGLIHVVSTYYASIHPGDEGFRCIANKMLFDLGITADAETIPASV